VKPNCQRESFGWFGFLFWLVTQGEELSICKIQLILYARNLVIIDKIEKVKYKFQ
jgi:hypothetical protein